MIFTFVTHTGFKARIFDCLTALCENENQSHRLALLYLFNYIERTREFHQ